MIRLALILALTACSVPHAGDVRDDVRRGISGAARELVCLVEEPRSTPAAYDPATECIHYDPVRLAALRESYGPAVPIAIIAHEVAHTQGHDERAADEVAGCALALEGQDLSPVFDYLESLDEPKDRTAAMLRGALRCEKE